jgi:hypothetical protein
MKVALVCLLSEAELRQRIMYENLLCEAKKCMRWNQQVKGGRYAVNKVCVVKLDTSTT